MIAAIYARKSTEQTRMSEELPSEIREFIIDKLAESLVLDYQQHGLGCPSDGKATPQRGES